MGSRFQLRVCVKLQVALRDKSLSVRSLPQRTESPGGGAGGTAAFHIAVVEA